MAFTRFHDDPCRVIKQNQQMTGLGRYMLDVPGNGITPPYMMDPQIIPQKWSGNLWSNSVELQNSLLGLDRKLNKDCLGINQYNRQTINSYPIQYPTSDKLTTEQSRAIMPAWTARDLEQVDWYFLPFNPQNNFEMKFDNYVSTRILEKDYFEPTVSCRLQNDQSYTLLPTNYMKGTQNICINSNSCQSNI
jgi:hypothetical protein